jgi:NodT family efflux transporter outer membrane factor (OMF) lipoprotein
MQRRQALAAARMAYAALALAASGCTVGPSFRVPDAPSVARYTSGDAPRETVVADGQVQHFVERDIPAEWWMLFGSPKLDQLVRQALAASPTLDEARARLVRAREDLTARKAATDYPAVDGNVGISRQRIDPATMGFPEAPNPGPFTLFNIGVDVSYTFDLFGGTRRELEALGADVDYQRYELEAAHLTLAANVVTTAIRQASLRAQLAATTAILDAQQEQLAIAQKRFAMGGVADVDVKNQTALVAQTASRLPSLRAQLAQTIHLLALYTGVAPGDAELPAIELADLRLPAELPVTLPSALARQRPDIRASEALLHRASANIGVATANLYPRLMLSGSAASDRTSFPDVFTHGINVWSIGANLLQPLFRSTELQARKRSAEAAYDQAAAAYRQTVLQGLQNVADALRALEADAQALAARTEQAAQAEQAYRITLERYRLGGVSQLAVLDAERQRLEAALERAQAAANRYADSAALLQALGGGWWNREPAPAAPPG